MTSSFPLERLPGSSRLWIYALDRPLTDSESVTLSRQIDGFISNWKSHSRPVSAGYEVRHHQFVLIAGVIPGGDISGCGIDASVHALSACGELLGFGIASGLEIFFRGESGLVEHVPRPVFRKLARTGAITSHTIVFDTSLTMLQDVFDGRFEGPAQASWHSVVFKLPADAS
jgi:uncharacterized heparinase superfamily protein